MSKTSKNTVVKETVKEVEVDTTNPLGVGVSYESFLKNVKGKETVDTLCKKHNISEDIIEFIKREIKNIKY